MDVELQNVIAHFPQVKEIREIESIQSGYCFSTILNV